MKHFIFACLFLGSQIILAAEKENDSKPKYDPVYGRAIRQSMPPQRPVAASAPESVYAKVIRQELSPANQKPGKSRPVSQQSPGVSKEIKIGKRSSVNLTNVKNHKPALSIPNILNQSEEVVTVSYFKPAHKKETTVELSPRTGELLDLELNEAGINIKTSAGEYQINMGSTSNGNQAVLITNPKEGEPEIKPIKNGKYRIVILPDGTPDLESLD
jgi:hypothetical protein